MQKITPFLWFNNNAEDAMNFYTAIFKDSKVGHVSRYQEGAPGPAGSVMVGSITLAGQDFLLLNGGPVFKFTEAVSFVISCENQAEIDYYWNSLTADGGQESQCGWLKDKFGLSWQVVPATMGQIMSNPDKAKAQRSMQAMMHMKKLDIKGLEEA